LTRTTAGKQIRLSVESPGIWSLTPPTDQARRARKEIGVVLDELGKAIDAANPQGETVFLLLESKGKRIRHSEVRILPPQPALRDPLRKSASTNVAIIVNAFRDRKPTKLITCSS